LPSGGRGRPPARGRLASQRRRQVRASEQRVPGEPDHARDDETEDHAVHEGRSERGRPAGSRGPPEAEEEHERGRCEDEREPRYRGDDDPDRRGCNVGEEEPEAGQRGREVADPDERPLPLLRFDLLLRRLRGVGLALSVLPRLPTVVEAPQGPARISYRGVRVEPDLRIRGDRVPAPVLGLELLDAVPIHHPPGQRTAPFPLFHVSAGRPGAREGTPGRRPSAFYPASGGERRCV
jgi:hypothetical protein